jgi:hypothetical protein
MLRMLRGDRCVNSAKGKSFAWFTAVAMIAALVASAATAGLLPAIEDDRGVAAVPNAASLARFYPTPLFSSPAGIVEEKQVWVAKVRGLVASAPSLLQHSLLNSQTARDFATNVDLLEQMQDGLLNRGALDLRRHAQSGAIAPNALGDTANLIYRPLTPCRIMDSRFATSGSGVQGPLNGGTLYNIPGLLVTGNTFNQYGGNTDCGLSGPPGGGHIKALAIVITILAPNFDAFLGVSDINDLSTVLSNVALNYTHGQGLSTMYVVPQDVLNTIFFAMPSQLVAHLIFDVIGLYAPSDATALECATTTPTTLTFTGTNGSLNSGACPAGFTKLGVACRTTAFNTAEYATIGISSGGSDCEATDTGGGTTLNATATCCRVPGM